MPEVVEITKELIKELVDCEKRIISEPSPRNKTNGQFKQTGCTLESTDGKYRFSLYIAEHIELAEIFSVGIIYLPNEATSIILARYNGDHGVHLNTLTREAISSFHIHQATQEAIDAGIKIENMAKKTDKYATANEALIELCKDMHITNYKDYFSDRLQRELFA